MLQISYKEQRYGPIYIYIKQTDYLPETKLY